MPCNHNPMNKPTTLNGQPQKTTAHQLWCDQINEQLDAILYPKSVRNGKLAFMTSKTRMRVAADQALQAVTHFENTRLRVVLDELIKKADATQKGIDDLRADIKALYIWQFGKRRQYMHMAQRLSDQNQAYREAILIMVNTPPEKKKEPVMKPNRDQ